MFEIRFHYLDGTYERDERRFDDKADAVAAARRILAMLARWEARGELSTDDVPWVWVVDAAQPAARTLI